MALAGYRAANPMAAGFPDDATKKQWLAAAEAMLGFNSAKPISCKKFIACANAICDSTYHNAPPVPILLEQLAKLYSQLHTGLNAYAFYMYACAAVQVKGRIYSKDKQFLDPMMKLLVFPTEIVEAIKAMPRLNDRGETTLYPGGYATLRVLSDAIDTCKRNKNYWDEDNGTYGCPMCRAHVPHFLCED